MERFGESNLISRLDVDIRARKPSAYRAVRVLSFVSPEVLSERIGDALAEALSVDAAGLLKELGDSPLLFYACDLLSNASRELQLVSIRERKQALFDVSQNAESEVLDAAKRCALHLDYVAFRGL